MLYSASNILVNSFPILVIKGTTNAFPMQKYLNFCGMPVFVQLSSKPCIRSASKGVINRNFFVSGSSITCVLRFTVDSEVSIVLAGKSSLSGNATGPSLKVYLNPFFAVYSSFLQRAYDQLILDCAIG